MAGLTMFAYVITTTSIVHLTFATEEKCSKYSYEREMISNMLKVELNVERMEQEIKERNENIVKMLEAQKKEMEKFAKDYQNLRDILVIVMENKTAEVASVLEDKKATNANVVDDKIEVINNALNSINEKVDNALKDRVETERSKTTVAFSVFVTLTKSSVTSGQIIVFDSIWTNVGGGYNSKSGKFIAPVTGRYLISCSILSWNGEEFWAAIAVNNSTKARLNDKGADSRHGMGTQTIVLELNANDVVTVIVEGSTRNIHGARYSTFSGVLLS